MKKEKVLNGIISIRNHKGIGGMMNITITAECPVCEWKGETTDGICPVCCGSLVAIKAKAV